MDIDSFKKEKIAAMKARDADAVTALNVIVSKLMNLTVDKRGKGETVTEADVVAVLKKTENELNEEREAFSKAGRADNLPSLDRQLATVKKYLPAMLSPEQIKEIIAGLSDKSVPAVMRHFKDNYAGKCDMRVVSETLKSL